MFGRIDHIGVAVEDIDAALTLYGGASRWSSRTGRRSRIRASRRSARRRRGPRRLLRPLAADTAVGKFLDRNGPGLHHVAYAVTTSMRPWLGSRRRHRADRQEPRVGIRGSRVAFLHPRSTGGVLTEISNLRTEDTDGKAQSVEIGFEGGQVVSVRLTEGELKDLRKQLEKGGWHDVKTEDGVLASTSARSPSCGSTRAKPGRLRHQRIGATGTPRRRFR